MSRDPPPALKPEEKLSPPAMRALARELLGELARYDRTIAARLHERRVEGPWRD